MNCEVILSIMAHMRTRDLVIMRCISRKCAAMFEEANNRDNLDREYAMEAPDDMIEQYPNIAWKYVARGRYCDISPPLIHWVECFDIRMHVNICKIPNITVCHDRSRTIHLSEFNGTHSISLINCDVCAQL